MKSNLSKYAAFFGREAEEILQPDETVPDSCFVYRFPPKKVGFFKRIFTPLHDSNVYMTDGMSNFDMTIPSELQSTYPKRVELLACTKDLIVGDVDKQDIVTRLLQLLASSVFQRQTFVGPVQAIDLGRKMCPNSEMTGFFFGVPTIEMPRLCRCTSAAELVVSVSPITAGELRLIKEKGPEALISAFEREGIPNLFDPFRKGVSTSGQGAL